MSRFFSSKHADLEPYTPGEQPRDTQYTKLNTNESPFPPSPAVIQAVTQEAGRLNLYCDPECTLLRQKVAQLYGVKPENILPVNGSDEILYFAFMAYGDETHPIAFPDISYGFYAVYAAIHHVPAHIIPLKEDFSIDYRDYCGLHETIVIANPNAPTGMTLTRAQVEEILKTNPNNVVVIDEAYVDFGGESCVSLINQYENLLVTQTFSKSRSLAGARLGFGIACESLIKDLNTLKYSTNPYNINRMTQAAGVAAVETNDYYLQNAQTIVENRAYTKAALEQLGFTVLPSCSNFLFARHPAISGAALYGELKKRAVLVRHFDKERIDPFVRITIGTKQQMDTLLQAVKTILQEKGEGL
jgi:histidinol-phosphate aminotransferase